MTSRAQTAANRLNALRSTGPKTKAGKKRVSQNALRHGLAVPAARDRCFSEQIEELALLIANPELGIGGLALARRIAEAEIDVMRVRRVRQSILESDDLSGAFFAGARLAKNYLAGPFQDIFNAERQLALLARCDRYERRALSRRKLAIRELEHLSSLGGSSADDAGRLQ